MAHPSIIANPGFTPTAGYSEDQRQFEVEAGLCAMLLFNNKLAHQIRDRLHPSMFLYPVHEQIYSAVLKAIREDSPVNVLTVQPSISNDLFKGETEKHHYLCDLATIPPMPTQISHYADDIRNSWTDRRMRQAVNNPHMDAEERFARTAEIVRELRIDAGMDMVPLGQTLRASYEAMMAHYEQGGGLTGLLTGLDLLDRTLMGMQAGGLYVLAARPAMGKTALAMTVALNAARAGKRVLFFSLEMSQQELAQRVYARFANVSLWDQRTARLDGDKARRICEVAGDLEKLPLVISETPGLTAEKLYAKARYQSRDQKPDLIIIDHLAIIAQAEASTPRVQAVAEMTMTFKMMAKELKVPILLLHQLNRGVEGREDKRPGLSDLRDSGAVEQDADAVMFLYRQEYYLQKEPHRLPDETIQRYNDRMQAWQDAKTKADGKADIIVAKNRHGETRNLQFRFDAVRQLFENEEHT